MIHHRWFLCSILLPVYITYLTIRQEERDFEGALVVLVRRKMIIHPDRDGDRQGHISVYLAVIGTSSLHAVWEVNASFSFFIFAQIHDNYSVMRGMERRFRNIKTERAFSKCISHETFIDPSSGYLVHDKCIFGVDVYVIKNQGKGECMSLLSGTPRFTSTNGRSLISRSRRMKCILKSLLLMVINGNLCYILQVMAEKMVRVSPFFLNQLMLMDLIPRKELAKFSISIKNQISGEHLKRSDASNWHSAAASS